MSNLNYNPKNTQKNKNNQKNEQNNQKNNKINQKKKSNPLLPISVLVLVVALVLIGTDLIKNLKKDTKEVTDSSQVASVGNAVGVTTTDSGDVVIEVSEISDQASFYEYEYEGETIGLFAVKASDGTIRTALNTCQVCNGSPYAFFEQKNNQVQCQNCGNLFSLDMVGQERGGCNPIPITGDDRTENESSIIIPGSFLEDNASLFTNWKKYE